MGALIGVAIGSRRDPTSLAVVEDEWRRDEDRNLVEHYLVRHLERLPPGTSYPAVARRIAEIVDALRERDQSWPFIFVDATGRGEPVVELIENAISRSRVRTVFFTHGDRRSEEGKQIILGKAFLVTRLQTLLQTIRLHLPRNPEAQALAQDLREYEVQVTEDANERYGAFRVGRHDDLITALGLAVHRQRKLPVSAFLQASRP
ncbi:MAG TPA: hypothetical protein VLF66_05280 [Thermoanaerobaculia bacterium]|nr:hypothetical protein [Thermoanaerobaculia bacterium]